MSGVASPALRAVQLGGAPILPRAWRLRISRALGELNSVRVNGRLATLARSGRPIVAGPWLGEVGFELLYWIPFLAWFAERFDVPRDRKSTRLNSSHMSESRMPSSA